MLLLRFVNRFKGINNKINLHLQILVNIFRLLIVK